MKKRTELTTYIDYDTESDKFKNFILPHPFSICYKVNQRCNYLCPHCIASGDIHATNGLPLDLSKKIIKQVKDCGIPRIDITGGEPFMREDILSILEYCCELELFTIVTTNGSLLKEEHLEFIKEHDIYLQISLDGTKEINDQLRGMGSYDQIVDAIEKVLKYGINLRVNITLQNSNKNCLEQLVPVLNEMGVKNIYIIFLCKQGRAFGFENKTFLTKEDIDVIKNTIKIMCNKFTELSIKILDFKTFEYSCTLIDVNGDLVSQSWSEDDCVVVGNLLEDSLKHLWMESGKFNHAIHLLQYLRHPLVME